MTPNLDMNPTVSIEQSSIWPQDLWLFKTGPHPPKHFPSTFSTQKALYSQSKGPITSPIGFPFPQTQSRTENFDSVTLPDRFIPIGSIGQHAPDSRINWALNRGLKPLANGLDSAFAEQADPSRAKKLLVRYKSTQAGCL